MIGPPIGVEPRNAMLHSAITRPRMTGSDASCRVEFPFDMNETLAAPTKASAISSTASVGDAAASASRARPAGVFSAASKMRLAIW